MERILASEVKPGDLLDLFGDSYADPNRDNMLCLEFELAGVEGVKMEGPNCVVIYTGVINFGCPPTHVLKKEGFDPRLAD